METVTDETELEQAKRWGEAQAIALDKALARESDLLHVLTKQALEQRRMYSDSQVQVYTICAYVLGFLLARAIFKDY